LIIIIIYYIAVPTRFVHTYILVMFTLLYTADNGYSHQLRLSVL